MVDICSSTVIVLSTGVTRMTLAIILLMLMLLLHYIDIEIQRLQASTLRDCRSRPTSGPTWQCEGIRFHEGVGTGTG